MLRRLKKFFLIILGFAAMTMVSLNRLSSIPIQEEAMPKMPDDLVALKAKRLHRDVNLPRLENQNSWTYWLLRLFYPQDGINNTHVCPKHKLWPDGFTEVNDRVLEQLKFSVTRDRHNSPETGEQNITKTEQLKTILVIPGPADGTVGRKRFLNDECRVNNCVITGDRNNGRNADAVLFRGGITPVGFKKPEDQIWIVYMLESPLHTGSLGSAKKLINMTATYRIDSTIVTPYERFVPYENASQYQLLPPKRNYASGKSKKVAWFVSNCSPKNNRMGYARELSKYMEVDIYGPCGNLRCPRHRSKQCFKMLNDNYKFYLAFENSNCKDYITEKFYWNGLLNDILPIVMGARPEDYAKVAPLNSYIHVDDFDSPKDLAAYLHKLDKNDDLYNNYFRWKGSGNFINTKFYCRLCAMVNDKSRRAWYDDVKRWWNEHGICISPTPHNKYASWKLEPHSSDLNMTRNPSLNETINPHYVHISSNSNSREDGCT